MLIKRIYFKILRIFMIDKLIYQIKYFFATKKINMDENEAYRKLMEFHPMPNSTPLTVNEIVSNEYDLTIIVPAYNSEKWVEECLDSVVKQDTNYKIKVKVINDGSTDNTLSLINKYKKYPFIEIINQENKGYSGARNIALKQIESKYIMFLDSDDLLESNAINVLLDTAHKYKSDIVEGSATAFNENGIVYTINKDNCEDTRDNLWGGPCFKVINSDLFCNLEFPMNYIYEDTIISYLVIPKAKKISTISNSVYRYRIHENSITQKHTKKSNRIDSFWIMLLVHDCMIDLNLPINYQSYMLTMRFRIHQNPFSKSAKGLFFSSFFC